MQPANTRTHKVCNRCKVEQPVAQFYRRRNGTQFVSCCKACNVIKTQEWVRNNPEKYRRGLERRTRREKDEYEAALGKPTRCEICGKSFAGGVGCHAGPNYDHNHDTGAARGWLCNPCNRGLGAFGDNSEILKAAAEYIRLRGGARSRTRFR